MNPYTPQIEPPFVCEKCKAIDSRPLGLVGNVISFVVIMAFACLAAHGLITIAKQQGIVDETGQHFWFEADFRKAIHGR